MTDKPRVRVKAGRRPLFTLVGTGNVVRLPVETTISTTSERVFQLAYDAGVTDLVVLGYNRSGHFYFAGTVETRECALWLLERARKQLLSDM